MSLTFKQFLLNETMTIKSMTSPKLKLTRQIKAYFPKDDLDEIYGWMKSAEAHGQPLTVDEYAEWRKMDDQGNPIKESIEDDLAQAKKELESAKKDNESRSANWQTKERLSAAYDKVADIKKQIERDSGKLNSASIIVPDDKVERIAKDLHAMGKTPDGFKSPWRMVRGAKKGTVVVRFDDYDTKNTGSGADVDDMINHVKKFEV